MTNEHDVVTRTFLCLLCDLGTMSTMIRTPRLSEADFACTIANERVITRPPLPTRVRPQFHSAAPCDLTETTADADPVGEGFTETNVSLSFFFPLASPLATRHNPNSSSHPEMTFTRKVKQKSSLSNA
ncbi:hypothetical protein BHE74_00027435 [Ensete ventricosum]|nr:hypothetical protein BHE74_00027435 [Ensete ventricosum]